MNMPTLGGRRFLLTVASLVLVNILQLMGKLDPAGSTYALVVVGTVGAYIGGNVLESNKGNKP